MAESGMRFAMPHYPCEFQIPDEWWAEADMAGFAAIEPSYRSTRDAELVPLPEIEPPYRKITTPHDWCGFDRARLAHILKGFTTGTRIQPVPLLELPPSDLPSRTPYGYRVLDGYHRFYASIAAGFECLPASVIR
jgi:hypothetical protein